MTPPAEMACYGNDNERPEPYDAPREQSAGPRVMAWVMGAIFFYLAVYLVWYWVVS